MEDGVAFRSTQLDILASASASATTCSTDALIPDDSNYRHEQLSHTRASWPALSRSWMRLIRGSRVDGFYIVCHIQKGLLIPGSFLNHLDLISTTQPPSSCSFSREATVVHIHLVTRFKSSLPWAFHFNLDSSILIPRLSPNMISQLTHFATGAGSFLNNDFRSLKKPVTAPGFRVYKPS